MSELLKSMEYLCAALRPAPVKKPNRAGEEQARLRRRD